ncbi:MAG: metal-dependent transcriptional regulator, partial [Spirochaetaceae bacterium]
MGNELTGTLVGRTLHVVTAQLTETQESYVETIYRLESDRRVARVKEIAATLGVSSPAVTKTLKSLAELDLVEYEPYGLVSLTEEGRRIGRDLLLRYRATEDFLRSVLGVAPELAEEVADSFEHHMPASVLCRLVQFVDHYKNSVEKKFAWKHSCAHLCER